MRQQKVIFSEAKRSNVITQVEMNKNSLTLTSEYISNSMEKLAESNIKHI